MLNMVRDRDKTVCIPLQSNRGNTRQSKSQLKHSGCLVSNSNDISDDRSDTFYFHWAMFITHGFRFIAKLIFMATDRTIHQRWSLLFISLCADFATSLYIIIESSLTMRHEHILSSVNSPSNIFSPDTCPCRTFPFQEREKDILWYFALLLINSDIKLEAHIFTSF